MTATKKAIDEAVRGLDQNDDANWTASGLPSVDAVSTALGERVTREDITGATDATRPTSGAAAVGKAPVAEMEGDPAAPSPGGGVDRDPTTGALVPSTGESQARAASKHSQYVPSRDGPEPDELFDALEKISAAASSPRFRRNQILQQIALLWRNEGQNARQAQDKMEGRIDRREAKRADREEAAAA